MAAAYTAAVAPSSPAVIAQEVITVRRLVRRLNGSRGAERLLTAGAGTGAAGAGPTFRARGTVSPAETSTSWATRCHPLHSTATRRRPMETRMGSASGVVPEG